MQASPRSGSSYLSLSIYPSLTFSLPWRKHDRNSSEVLLCLLQSLNVPLIGSGFEFHLSVAIGHVSADVAQDARVATSKTYSLASVPRLRAIGALCISSGGFNSLHLLCL